MSQPQTLNFQDMFLRSRKTILEMLSSRGYNIDPYSKLGGSELVKLATGSPEAVQMTVQHKSDEEKKAIVKYSFTRIKQSLNREILDMISPEGENPIDPLKTEVIYILMEELADTFHAAALEAWLNHKLQIQFFWMPTLVVNPMTYAYQPKFEILPREEHEQFMKKNYINSKAQLPSIRFHSDIIARYLGLAPGDITKITRPSPAAGEYVLYRVCTP